MHASPPLRSAPFPVYPIVPPHLLHELAKRSSGPLADRALQSLLHSERLRGHRDAMQTLGSVGLLNPPGVLRRTVYDAKGSTFLPGQRVRGEGDPAGTDRAVNEAFEHAGTTYAFFREVFGRNSIDNRGMRLDASVHYSQHFDNAFWNGMQMVYGDGDGQIFGRFTRCLDVIGHELTHGVTQHEAGLHYSGEPGALNESISDVMGSLVRQWKLKQPADRADWLIGAGLFTPSVRGAALRSMKAPGTAYDDPRLGRDPQPAHMRDFQHTLADNGGVHINSGIPNRAFYLTAVALKGYAWERAGQIWYDTLCHRLQPNADFKAAAQSTIAAATERFGLNSEEHRAVADAWRGVGVL